MSMRGVLCAAGGRRATRHKRGLIVGFGLLASVASAAVLAAPPALALEPGSGHGAPAAKFPPNLSGESVTFADGSPPAVSDTQLYLMTEFLAKWGAKTNIVNETGDPAAVTVVLAGDANAAYISTGDVIDSHLVAFGPAQPRLDYQFVTAPSIAKMSELAGHTFGWSNPHGIEAEMFGALLDKYHIARSKVTTELAGSSSVREAALLTGRIQATFLSTSEWEAVNAEHKGYHDLAVMGTVEPSMADSMMAASSSFLAKNPILAVAIDEAWLEAAHVFQTSPSQWVTAALKYTAGTATRADAVEQLKAFKVDGAFPYSASAFSASAAEANEKDAAAVGALTSKPALSVWFKGNFWNEAVAAVVGG